MYSSRQEVNKDRSSEPERAKDRASQIYSSGQKKVNDRSYKCIDQIKKVLKIKHKTIEMVS